MFPYRIRKPAWGSLKPLSQLSGDAIDPHAFGGNLERAVLLDFRELRRRYFGAVASSRQSSNAATSDAAFTMAAASSVAAAATPAASLSCGPTVKNVIMSTENSNPHRTKSHHSPLGSSFALFKRCFREARFGAIHTRTVPPRVDRGEYAQLLYSSCFHLLEESFKCHYADQLHWDDGSHPNFAFNAIYAAFMLYTLHRINILHEAPPPRPHTKRTRSGRFEEKSLKEAWSMLCSMGNYGEDDKLHRQAYRSGVRVDRWNYLLLLRLRDICLAQVDQCCIDERQSTVNNSAADGTSCRDAPWQCRCGMARDAAHVIDKMIFDGAFFEYCEYHGPHSLEGLAGSSNFYVAHFVKQPLERKLKHHHAKKISKQSKQEHNEPTAPLASSGTLTYLELSAMGSGELLRVALDLPNLSKIFENHCSRLSSVVGRLDSSRQKSGDLQPKQTTIIENTLRGIMGRSTHYTQMVDKFDAEKALNANNFNMPSPRPNAQPPLEARHAESKQELLKYPETFSSTLCNNIRGALLDFIEEADMIKIAVVNETKIHMTRDQIQINFDLHDELACLDDFDVVPTHQKNWRSEKVLNEEVILSTNRSQRKKYMTEVKNFSEFQAEEAQDQNMLTSAPENEDKASIAIGVGKNALLSLLSMVEVKNDSIDTFEKQDDFSIATGAGKDALSSLLAMAYQGNNKSDPSEEESVSSEDDKSELQSLVSMVSNATSTVVNEGVSTASEMGKRALRILLTQHTNLQEDKPGARLIKTMEREGEAQKLPSRTPRKRIGEKNAKPKPLVKNHPPHTSLEQPTTPGVVDVWQREELGDFKDAYGESTNASLATGTGMSGDKEFLIPTEGPGSYALAALLSNAKNLKRV